MPYIFITVAYSGTSVTFPTDSGDSTIGTVKGFEVNPYIHIPRDIGLTNLLLKNGKYHVEVNGGTIVEVEEAKAKVFAIMMSNRGIYETFK